MTLASSLAAAGYENPSLRRYNRLGLVLALSSGAGALATAVPAGMTAAAALGAWTAAATGCAMPYVRHLSAAVATARQVRARASHTPIHTHTYTHTLTHTHTHIRFRLSIGSFARRKAEGRCTQVVCTYL